jgi:hypothetical protein
MSQYQREYREMLRADEEKKEKRPSIPQQEYQKEYRSEHREHLQELQKDWREKHKRYYRPERKSLWGLEDEARWKSLMV